LFNSFIYFTNIKGFLSCVPKNLQGQLYNWNQGLLPNGAHCVWVTISRFRCHYSPLCLSFFRSLSLSGSWPCGLAIYKQTCNTCRHISLSLLCLPVCVCVWGCPSTPRLSPSHSCLLMSSPATNRQKDTNSWLRLNGNCETVVGRSLAAISFPLPQCTSMRECVHTCVCVWCGARVCVDSRQQVFMFVPFN